jgi:hypothetical protein
MHAYAIQDSAGIVKLMHGEPNRLPDGADWASAAGAGTLRRAGRAGLAHHAKLPEGFASCWATVGR